MWVRVGGCGVGEGVTQGRGLMFGLALFVGGGEDDAGSCSCLDLRTTTCASAREYVCKRLLACVGLSV